MSRFYEHLAGGESVSESLHQAMKWMRSNGFTKVSEWAPFMLIGDNVTFDFKINGRVFCSICLFIYLLIYLFTYLFTYLLIYLFIYLYIYLFI